jgi:hypothetical protein
VNDRNDVFATTLENTLSSNTVAMALSSRGMSFNGTQSAKTLRFYYIDGFLEVPKYVTQTGQSEFMARGIVITGQSAGTHSAVTNSNQFTNVLNGTANIRHNDRMQDRPANDIWVASTSRSLIQRVRSQLPAGFVSIHEKSIIFVKEFKEDRTSLEALPPTSQQYLHRATADNFFSQLIMQSQMRIDTAAGDITARRYAVDERIDIIARYRDN